MRGRESLAGCPKNPSAIYTADDDKISATSPLQAFETGFRSDFWHLSGFLLAFRRSAGGFRPMVQAISSKHVRNFV